MSQIPKYFSFETSYVYAYATYTLHLMEKWHLAPTVGYADFEKKDIAGLYNDYYHAKLGLQYKVEKYTLEIAGSHTNRRGNDGTGNNNVKLQDDAVIATYTVVF